MHAPWAIHRPWLASIFGILHSRMGEAPGAETFAAEHPLEHAARLRHGSGAGRFFADRWGKSARGLVNHSARIHSEAVKRCGGSYAAYEEITATEQQKLEGGQILHVFGSGIIGKHLSSMEEMCAGGLSVDRIQQALKTAEADDKVSGVVLHLDTPGGVCFGGRETADLVARVSESKPVTNFCDSLTASMGVWLACRADYVYITPSAEYGSIGVYCAFADYSEWCKKQGIEMHVFADGKHKGAGVLGTSLTDEQKDKILADVKLVGAMFREDVRAGRSAVKDETMEGQTFIGKNALAAGLADTVVPDLEAVLADMAKIV